MKIYFAGSIRGGRGDKEIYSLLINHLRKHGEVLTEHVGDKDLEEVGEIIPDEEIFKRDVKWLKSADFVVAEVTTTSLGVGYEIGLAESLGKKILCLHRHQYRRLSAMIAGNKNVTTAFYNDVSEAFRIIDDFLSR